MTIKMSILSNVFVSKLEEIMVAEELFFDSTPGFGKYKLFMEQSIAHPAKMNTRLLEFLVKTHTKEGDVVLDPMAGSGSTGVISALHGRNAINVELEEKFHGWMEEARKKVEVYNTLSHKGKIANIKGDARQLSKILKEADAIVTSPPYSSGGWKADENPANPIKREAERKKLYPMRPPDAGRYSENPSNIGNLPHGEVDAVITSPPYVDGTEGPSRSPLWERLSKDPTSNRYGRKTHPTIGEGYGKSKNNIGNLPIDAVITSPPYAETYTGGGDPEKRRERLVKAGHDSKDFLGGKARNAVLKHYSEVDAVITSPPFADGFKHNPQDKEKRLQKLIEVDKKGVEKGQKWAPTSREALERRLAMQDDGYGKDEANIGNLKHTEVDTIITSPPYAETQSFQDVEFMKKIQQNQNEKLRKGEIKGHSKTEVAAIKEFEKIEKGKIENPENIGNLGFVDSVITSPPYAEGIGHGGKRRTKILTRDKGIWLQGKGSYSENAENIGEMRNETYLEAMLKVYAEMWKVLKPDGLAIIVIKPFIRNKKVVDLPWHTWLLLEKVGFKLTKLYKLYLKQDSFWRVLYKKKYPLVPQIKHEYIIVCQKSLRLSHEG
jgi:DNA modification methylase